MAHPADLVAELPALGLRFVGTPARTPDPQLVIGPGGYDGWEGGTELVRETIKFPRAAGGYALPGTVDSRMIRLGGVAVAASPEALRRLGDRLSAALIDGSYTKLAVTHGGATRWALVGLAATTRFVTRGESSTEADWQIQLFAPDPRKYGVRRAPVALSAVPSRVKQEGSVPGPAVVRVTGTSTDNYGIHGPGGRSIIVSRPLAAGDVHEVDVETGALTVNGTRVIGGIISAYPFSIAPGPGSEITFDANGNALTASVRATDAFA
ncbi:phage tail family protein [Herbiconiux moechotypicola]|uniref:Phage tail protein n=1 Tax=Herbiconiux moechotypicola TaxID=637393 RepID=A0ABP5QAF4_9MICO|nr:phage tail family protein [Herbiconiux moechotypicola]MCS5729494.1 phage tail family protein [Herbiconiux moechotypicola]